MKKSDSNNNAGRVLIALLVAVPVIAAIVYFKIEADDGVTEDPIDMFEEIEEYDIAVPDTTITAEITPVEEETIVYVATNDSVGVDTRPAMEAGDEDGYWDGWYDGADKKKKQRYDESCAYSSTTDKDTYAKYYREGYEKGYREAAGKQGK